MILIKSFMWIWPAQSLTLTSFVSSYQKWNSMQLKGKLLCFKKYINKKLFKILNFLFFKNFFIYTSFLIYLLILSPMSRFHEYYNPSSLVEYNSPMNDYIVLLNLVCSTSHKPLTTPLTKKKRKDFFCVHPYLHAWVTVQLLYLLLMPLSMYLWEPSPTVRVIR